VRESSLSCEVEKRVSKRKRDNKRRRMRREGKTNEIVFLTVRDVDEFAEPVRKAAPRLGGLIDDGKVLVLLHSARGKTDRKTRKAQRVRTRKTALEEEKDVWRKGVSPEDGRKDIHVIFGIVDKGNEFVHEMTGMSELLFCSGHLVCQPPDLSNEVAVLVPLFQDLESACADRVDDGSLVGQRVAILDLRDGTSNSSKGNVRRSVAK